MRKKNNFYPASLLTQQGTKKPKTSKMKKVAFFGTVMLLAVIMARLTVLGKFDRIFPVPENLVVLGWKQIQVQPGNTVWGFAKKYNNIGGNNLIFIFCQKQISARNKFQQLSIMFSGMRPEFISPCCFLQQSPKFFKVLVIWYLGII